MDLGPDRLYFGVNPPEEETASPQDFLLSCRQAGAGIYPLPTSFLTETNLSDTSREEELSRLLREQIETAETLLPAGAPLFPVISPEPQTAFSCGAFEEVYMDLLEKYTAAKSAGADGAICAERDRLWVMRSAVLAAKTARLPLILFLQTDEDGTSESGTDALAALLTLQSLGAAAFGVAAPEGCAGEIIRRLFPHADIPLCVLSSEQDFPAAVSAGAGILLSATLPAFGALMPERFPPSPPRPAEIDSYGAAVECEAFFLPEDLVLSDPLPCSYSLSDALIDCDDDNINTIVISLRSSDDAAILAENSTMTRLPLTVTADDANTLEAALRYFSGRLLVDSGCDIDRSELMRLCSAYGAILY